MPKHTVSSARRVAALLVAISRIATGMAFGMLIFAVLVQVLGRSIFADSPVWSEELSRFALLFLAAFGAGLSYRNGELVNVDIICEALPGRLPWLLRLVSAVLTAILCAALIMPAWHYTLIGALQTSPALEWRMDLIHASLFVLLISLLIFALLRIFGMVLGFSDGLPASAADEDRQ